MPKEENCIIKLFTVNSVLLIFHMLLCSNIQPEGREMKVQYISQDQQATNDFLLERPQLWNQIHWPQSQDQPCQSASTYGRDLKLTTSIVVWKYAPAATLRMAQQNRNKSHLPLSVVWVNMSAVIPARRSNLLGWALGLQTASLLRVLPWNFFKVSTLKHKHSDTPN